MPGRWIFTATTRPSCNRARCTCASEAEPSGTVSKLANRDSTVSPSALSSCALISGQGVCVTWLCMRVSAVRYAGGTRSGRVDSACPSLTNVGPSASRSSTNWSGLWSADSVSIATSSGTRRSHPVNIPEWRYFTRKRRMRLVRASCWPVGFMGPLRRDAGSDCAVHPSCPDGREAGVVRPGDGEPPRLLGRRFVDLLQDPGGAQHLDVAALGVESRDVLGDPVAGESLRVGAFELQRPVRPLRSRLVLLRFHFFSDTTWRYGFMGMSDARSPRPSSNSRTRCSTFGRSARLVGANSV